MLDLQVRTSHLHRAPRRLQTWQWLTLLAIVAAAALAIGLLLGALVHTPPT